MVIEFYGWVGGGFAIFWAFRRREGVVMEVVNIYNDLLWLVGGHWGLLGIVGAGWGWLGVVGDGWGWLGMVGGGWG